MYALVLVCTFVQFVHLGQPIVTLILYSVSGHQYLYYTLLVSLTYNQLELITNPGHDLHNNS